MFKLWKAEPALIVGVLQALVALAVSFGFNLSADQIGALVAAMAAVFAVVTRTQVTPKAA